jgi:hypothetical protein
MTAANTWGGCGWGRGGAALIPTPQTGPPFSHPNGRREEGGGVVLLGGPHPGPADGATPCLTRMGEGKTVVVWWCGLAALIPAPQTGLPFSRRIGSVKDHE